jgi:hypothetical protein
LQDLLLVKMLLLNLLQTEFTTLLVLWDFFVDLFSKNKNSTYNDGGFAPIVF